MYRLRFFKLVPHARIVQGYRYFKSKEECDNYINKNYLLLKYKYKYDAYDTKDRLNGSYHYIQF